MTPLYSTRDVHPRDRLSYWIEVATKAYFKHQFASSAGAAYFGSIQWGALADLDVSIFECDPCDVLRSEKDAAFGDCEDFILSLQLGGGAVHGQDGRHVVGRNGGFVLMDARRAHTTSFTQPSNFLVLKIPRQALAARLGDVTPLLVRPVDPENAIVRLASGFLAMLPARIAALDGPAAANIAEQALDLIALAFSTASHKNGTALSSARAGALLRLKAAVSTHLGDADLKPSTAAVAAGLSVRYANALLAQEGTSLERYIISRRLARCRRALEDPAQAQRTIGEIAYGWGFSDLSHFARRFKGEFGLSPSDYRHQAKQSLPPRGPAWPR